MMPLNVQPATISFPDKKPLQQRTGSGACEPTLNLLVLLAQLLITILASLRAEAFNAQDNLRAYSMLVTITHSQCLLTGGFPPSYCLLQAGISLTTRSRFVRKHRISTGHIFFATPSSVGAHLKGITFVIQWANDHEANIAAPR